MPDIFLVSPVLISILVFSKNFLARCRNLYEFPENSVFWKKWKNSHFCGSVESQCYFFSNFSCKKTINPKFLWIFDFRIRRDGFLKFNHYPKGHSPAWGPIVILTSHSDFSSPNTRKTLFGSTLKYYRTREIW